MSRLDELIEEYCPEGVEYKELREIFNTRNGFTPSKSKPEFWEGELSVPWFRMEDIRENGNILYDSIQHVTPQAVKGKIFPADSIIVATSATIGEHALIRVDSLANQRFTYLMLKEQYKDKFDIKFLYYYCYKLDEWCLGHLNQSSFSSVDMLTFCEFKFPVPPLEVQREIVRVLDAFTLLTTELTTELITELTARKRQYEYYRGKLLSFNSKIQRYPLRDFVNFRNGKGHEKNITVDGKYIVVNSKFIATNGEVRKYSDNQICPLYINDILMVMSDLPNGRALAKCYLVEVDDKYTLNQRIGAFHVKSDGINTRFLFHVLNRNQQLLSYDNGMDQTNLRKDDILNILIPVPSLDVQNRIVYVLDNFETICNDLRIGIPAEIEARQKQYEYYRDKLLTFKELSE